MTSPAPDREPEPADDLVEWLNEMRIYEENSEETTEAFTRTIARIRADAETIRALREEVARQKLRVTELESWRVAVYERAERAEAKLTQAMRCIEAAKELRKLFGMLVLPNSLVCGARDKRVLAFDAALAELEKINADGGAHRHSTRE